MLPAAEPNRVCVACTDGTLQAFYPIGNRREAPRKGHKDGGYRVALSPDGKKLASGTAAGPSREPPLRPAAP